MMHQYKSHSSAVEALIMRNGCSTLRFCALVGNLLFVNLDVLVNDIFFLSFKLLNVPEMLGTVRGAAAPLHGVCQNHKKCRERGSASQLTITKKPQVFSTLLPKSSLK